METERKEAEIKDLHKRGKILKMLWNTYSEKLIIIYHNDRAVIFCILIMVSVVKELQLFQEIFIIS